MKLTYALAISVLFAASSIARAQSASPPRTFGDGGLPEFLQPYDLDGDGKLSAEERDAARAARPTREDNALSRWDTDHDGVLSQAELDAARAATRRHIDLLRDRRFDEANTDKSDDTDTEQYLSRAEFGAMCLNSNLPPQIIEQIFARIDTDTDGRISRTEFLRSCQPPPPLPPLPPFATADVDTSADVSLAEFVAACAALVPTVDETRATDMFTRLDGNHDGKLVLGEYPGTHPVVLPVMPAFAVADANTDAFVDHTEFVAAATTAGFPAMMADEMFRQTDLNRDGKLDLAEYFRWLPQPVLPAFAVADADGNGSVNLVEFVAAATGVGYPPRVANDLFFGADRIRDSKLVPMEYASLLPPPVLPTFDTADTSLDGFVDAAEFLAAATAAGLLETMEINRMFGCADSNHDQKLSPDEYASLKPMQPRPRE